MTEADRLRPFREHPEASAVLLDYDGTLSEIVDRPEGAVPAPGAADVVRALVGRFPRVAVISGRPTEDVAAMVGVEGVTYLGHYGFEESDSFPQEVASALRAAVREVPGVRAEPKGRTFAVHYRMAPDRQAARARVLELLRDAAGEAGLEVIEGKMVLELVPKGLPRKDGAVRRVVRESGVRATLYAGDDVADLEAFAALDDLRNEGIETVKIAVRGPETPKELMDAADITVDGPSGLIELLRDLASDA